ncbi:bacterial Ig-like domain-containing protein [Eubacterium limosum]|uniref:bacterial Ig-like domain-containing protein n=1 Tax=Eubacterium limosum TaxID=1736 RepID=UPI00371640C5
MNKKKIHKGLAGALAGVMLTGLLSPISVAFAEENITVGIEQSKGKIFPGETETVTVSLPNYSTIDKEIGGMQIVVDFTTQKDVLYVKDSAKSLGNEDCTVSYPGENKIAINFLPLRPGYPVLPKDVKDVLSFEVKADESLKGEKTVEIPIKFDFADPKLTWTYSGSGTIDVNIAEKKAPTLTVDKMPNQTTFNEGDTFNCEGGMLMYDDNGSWTRVSMTHPDVIVSGYDMNKTGDQTVTCTYNGISTTYSIFINESPVTGISMVKAPSPALNGSKQPNYIEGQDFEVYTDGVLEVTHQNGKKERVAITDNMVTGYEMNKVGSQKVSVSYNGFKVDYDIEVMPKEVTGISVASTPDITEYIEGAAALVVDGGQIKVSYNNGKDETRVLTQSMCSGYDLSKPGKQDVKISLDGKTTSFKIEVLKKSITGIAIAKTPTDNFVVGEAFSVENGRITVFYNNNTQEEMDMTVDMCSGYDMNSVGDQTVTVSYKSFSAEYPITILEKVVEDLELVEAPAPAINGVQNENFVQDQDFAIADNGIVRATFNDGTTKEVKITEGMCSGYDLSRPGTTEVIVSYGGKTVSFSQAVVAKQATGITVDPEPVKKQYKIELDKELDVAGGKVKTAYNNGKYEVVDLTQEMCSGYDLSNVGETTVTVQYDGFETSFVVEVLDKIATQISVVTLPNKTSFTEGTAFNCQGGELEILYDNQTKETVPISLDMCSDYDMDKVGVQTVKVTHKGLTASYKIEILKAVVDRLDFISKPTKITFIEGLPFESDGLIRATYNNGKTEEIMVTKEMCSGYDMNKVGKQEVTINYGGKTTNYTIDVKQKELTGIVISSLPKDQYLSGDSLNLDAGVIEASYNNGTKEAVKMTDSRITVYGYRPDSLGKQTLTAEMGSFRTTFDVEVLSREAVNALIADIDKISLNNLNEDDRAICLELLSRYNGLTEVEREAVTNYGDLTLAIDRLNEPYHLELFLEGVHFVVDGPEKGMAYKAQNTIIKAIVPDHIKATISEKLGEDAENIGAYDVSYSYFGHDDKEKEVKPSALLTYAISVDKEQMKDRIAKIAVISDDGSISYADAVYENGHLIFETEKTGTFSIWLIKSQSNVQLNPNNSTQTPSSINNPKTGILHGAKTLSIITCLGIGFSLLWEAAYKKWKRAKN